MKNLLRVAGITIALTAIGVAMRATKEITIESKNRKSNVGKTYIDKNSIVGFKKIS